MVRYGSGYRLFLINRLRDSIVKVLKKNNLHGKVEVVGDSRIVISDINREYIEKYKEVLVKVFGISSISLAVKRKYRFKEILDALDKLIKHHMIDSFKLIVEGEPGYDRSFLVKILSTKLIEKYGLRVDLLNPDKTFYIEIRDGNAYIMDEVLRGFGGLPFGVEGCLVTLVSGGVDSALAVWYLLKRGVNPILVYIDQGSYWSSEAHKRFYESLEYIREWVAWDHVKLYIVKNMGDLIARAEIPDRLRCLFCKATMYRIASIIADRENCKGIATGEAVGQVSSQTLSNLSILSKTIDKPVFRPLSFMDKLEIIEMTRKLGFSKLSRNVGSCRLKPEKPETNASLEDYRILLEVLDKYNDVYRDFVDESIVKYI
ncbi:MAG: thiamine biosynthesis protein [Desulfurococcales archaeon ex4484_58]|nr:MAG: thiamine biosynthesis protein [Desulfurococcales archaeon ex4484_58]